MKTFAERYCAAHACAPTDFCRRVFWSALHRRAVAFAPVLLWVNHFELDRALITACSQARSLRQIQEEIECFRRDPQNTGLLRTRLRLRVSSRRLQRIAIACFSPSEDGAGATPLPPVITSPSAPGASP